MVPPRSRPSGASTRRSPTPASAARAASLEDTPEHWREMVLTNVLGAALTIRATMAQLIANRGHLLLTSSVAGRRVLPGSLYSCTKHAVTAMGEAARQDLHGTGVRVTLIEPGMVDTPFFDERPQRRAAGRRHRPRGDLRGLPARARERQRDPDPPHRPGRVAGEAPRGCRRAGQRARRARAPWRPARGRRRYSAAGTMLTDAPAPAGLELDRAGGTRVQRVVLADARRRCPA